jgi:hypothetical protein
MPHKNAEDQNTIIGELKQLVNQQLPCNTNFLEYYISSEQLEESIPADENIAVLCPFIQNSCCTHEQLVQVHNQTTRSHKKITRLIKLLVSLANRMTSLDENKKTNIIKAISEKQCYYNEGEKKTLEEITTYLIENNASIVESFNKGLNFYSQENAKFGCAICDQKSHEWINTEQEPAQIQVDSKQCKTFFGNENIEHYVNAFAHIRYLFIFYRSLACTMQIGVEGDSEFFFLVDEVPETLETLKLCSTNNEMETNQLCDLLCDETDLFNINVLAPYNRDFSIFELTADKLFSQTQITEIDQNSYSNMMNKINREAWVQPLQNVDQAEIFELTYVYGSGWNNSDHTFVQNNAEIINNEDAGNKIVLIQ